MSKMHAPDPKTVLYVKELRCGWFLYLLRTKAGDRQKGRQRLKLQAPSGTPKRRGKGIQRTFWLTWWKSEQRFLYGKDRAALDKNPDGIYTALQEQAESWLKQRFEKPKLEVV